MKALKFLVLALCLVASFAAGQENMMSPPPELSKLSWQLGEWSGKMVWSMPGMEGEADMSWSTVMEGNFMKSTSKMSISGMEMIETGYVGWDADKKEYFMHTFTNFAHTPRVERGNIDGDKMVMVSDPWNAGMGGPTVSRATVTRKSDTELTMLLEFKNGEEWSKVGEGTFKKKA